jgi:hypothetical protein
MSVDNQITEWMKKRKLANILGLIESFKESQIAVIDGLLPPGFFEEMRREADVLLTTEAMRREVVVEESGNTPRAYTSVGRDAIACGSKVIPAIFHNEAVRDLLSQIAGEALEKVPYEPEEFILNRQSLPGDTHGWHWDDYAYALILVLEAPDPLVGGRVEYVPFVEWQKNNTEQYLRDLLMAKPTRSAHIKAGQCYFMKTNTTLHRITPLAAPTTRTVAVITFASPEDMVSDSITHHSMQQIYPESTKASASLAAVE